jgi:hypothetical protein
MPGLHRGWAVARLEGDSGKEQMVGLAIARRLDGSAGTSQQDDSVGGDV